MNNDLIRVDGKIYKECNIDLLPTNAEPVKGMLMKRVVFGETTIWQFSEAFLRAGDYIHSTLNSSFEDWYKNFTMQHMYVTLQRPATDEEIRIKWCYFEADGSDLTCIAGKTAGRVKTPGKYYVIVTTTDETLGLPRPSDAFLKKYCELNGINNVMVEYVDFEWYDGSEPIVKVAPDNTVTIKPVKKPLLGEGILEYMVEHHYNKTNPVLYGAISDMIIKHDKLDPPAPIKETEAEYSYQEVIQFATWYSGMAEPKVVSAWNRWLREKNL